MTLHRERNVILALPLVLAAASWAILVWQSTLMDNVAMGLIMGMGAALFLANWPVMMVTMMFPTAAPMILMFTRVHADKRQSGKAFVPTWVFVSSYLVIWTLFGSAGIYLGAVWIEGLAQQVPWLTANDGRIGGGVLVLAGLHQLSPLKRSRLAKCRTPLDFILSSWRDGYVSSFHMGLEHGIYCLGCCWLLFVIFFPLGMMNVAVMAVVTILIFAEKSLPIRKANFPVGRSCTDRLWDVGGNDARGAAHDGSTNVYADIHANVQWAGETELEGRVSPSHSIASTLILRDRYAISMKEVSFASMQKEYVDIFKAKQ